jgi:hypothetical protein
MALPLLGLVITCSNKKCVVVFVLQSFTGAASSHLVRYFIMVMMYLVLVHLAGGLIGPQSLFLIYQMPVISLVIITTSHPFCWVCLPFDKHHIPDSTLSSLYESLATIILCGVPSTRWLLLHSALLPIPRGILLKFLVIRALTRTFVKCYLRSFYIDVL